MTLTRFLFLAGGYPLWRVWSGNRQTPLIHSLMWATAAWLVGVGMLWGTAGPSPPDRYLFLCLLGCAGVGVLGARRPGAGAWHLVVGGLLAVLLLPLAESLWAGEEFRLAWFRAVLLGGVLAVGVLNYLPTAVGPAAALLGLGAAWELLLLAAPGFPGWLLDPASPVGLVLVGLAPWLGLWEVRRSVLPEAGIDQTWRDFRDRFGLVWAQRLREQFNRSAANAGWPVVLRWRGLRLARGAAPPGADADAAIRATLKALMKRFGPPDSEAGGRND